MKLNKIFAFCSMFVMLVSLTGVFPAAAAPLAAGGVTRQIPRGGTTVPTAAAPGVDSGIQNPEFSSAAEGDTADSGGDSHAFHGVNRSFSSPTTGNGRTVNSHKQAKSNPELNLSMDGLNF